MNSLIPNTDNNNLINLYGITYTNAIKQYFKYNKVLTYDSIVKYLNDCKGNYSNSTIALYKAALKKYIKTHIKNLSQRAILDLAFNDIKIPKSNKIIIESKIINKDIVLNMMNHANIKDALIIEMLFISGLRVSEMTHIEIKNCNSINDGDIKYISIKVIGKGNKERFINISVDLFYRIRNTFRGEIYLFETKNSIKYTRQYIHLIVRKAGRRILGTNQVHPHTLRHSFATHLLINEKQSIKAVSKYLGHSSTAITNDFYIHDSIAVADIINMI